MDSKSLVLDFSANAGFDFASSIESALAFSQQELVNIQETVNSVNALRPQCDKLDYILSASAGALCGIVDIFLVGKPGESPIGNLTDKWFDNRTKDFAKLCGWDGEEDSSLASAIRHLEKKFKIPYDQTTVGEAAKEVFDLNTFNHHLKSLGHNPTLLGLFFSVLDQFKGTSHFVSGELLLTLEKADEGFELQGHNIPAKLFAGIANWFGHMVSDVSGSSGSKGRGMGIPSPIWAWTNDLIVIANKLHISANELNRSMNELAVNVFKEGFDLRFQTAQLIPVFLTEIIVRFCYAIRRMYQYFSSTGKGDRSFSELWKACKPFGNPSVKRMLTVAHGAFCLLDVGDAVIRGFATGGGSFNVTEFFLRVNIAEFGRFAISLYGEGKRGIELSHAKHEADYAQRKKYIVDNYISGLHELSRLYDDKELLSFASDFEQSDMYLKAFQKSVDLAVLRGVPQDKILKDKNAIDIYFSGENKK